MIKEINQPIFLYTIEFEFSSPAIDRDFPQDNINGMTNIFVQVKGIKCTIFILVVRCTFEQILHLTGRFDGKM